MSDIPTEIVEDGNEDIFYSYILGHLLTLKTHIKYIVTNVLLVNLMFLLQINSVSCYIIELFARIIFRAELKLAHLALRGF